MAIKTFLTDYWIYIAALGLAIWNIYLHFKTNKTERKKNLQAAYIELTGIINDFQVDCLKHLHLEPEVMILKLKVSEDIDNAKEILKNVSQVKKAELLEKKDELTDSITKLKEDYEQATDAFLKNKLREDIKVKIAAVTFLINELKEENLKNKPFLDRAQDIHQIAAQKVSMFNKNRPHGAVSLSKVVINLINKLNSASAWQLIASKSTLKIINELESSASKLNTKILNLVTDEVGKVNIDSIVKSKEFGITWKLCENAIKKMRSEVL